MERHLPVPVKPNQSSQSYSLVPSSGVVPPAPAPAPAAPVQGAPVELPTLDFLGLFHTLARRKWIILAAMVFWVGLAVLFLKHSPEVFESVGELEVESEDMKISPFDPIRKQDFRSIDALKTVEHNLQSTDLIMRMIKNHDLESNLQGSQAMQIAQIQGRSTIQLVRGTRKVSISYRSKDPEFAKRVVDAYIEEFEAEEREARHAVQDGAKEDLAAREKELLDQLETATNSLKDYKEANAELDLRSDGNVIGTGLSDLMVRAAEARANRLDLEKQLGTAATVTDPKRLLEISSIATLPEIRDLRTTIREKAVAFETLKKTFGYKHQTYIEAETEIQQFESKLAEAARSALAGLKRDYNSAVEKEAAYSKASEQSRGQVAKREQVLVRIGELDSEIAGLQNVLDEVTTKLRETEVSSGLETTIIRVKQKPMIAELPIWPNKPFIMAGGLMLGMISGIALAFALEMLRRRIRDEGDVSKILSGVTCLSQVPATKIRTPQDNLIVANDPHSIGAESFRALRTSLYFRPQGEPKVVVITSANSGDGKSFCAMNCAAAYAMQGHQTLLVDGDLRCPSLEEVFLRGRNRGMTEFLRGRAEPQDICYPTQVNGLYFIPSGELRSNPSELLSGPRLEVLIEQASQYFDKIVIDSAPLVPVSDGLMLASHADATCLVVRSNTTKKNELHKVRQTLSKTGHPLAGYTLNGVANGQSESTYVTYMSKQQRLNLKSKGDEVPALPARAEELSKKAAML
ncbi:MAG: polysaccharide biosynthesis tyrosine autokinase [Verrucomicrobiales bacterium]|nr:polysaccharide biosynthesis tyrosine autokinase [Verrucomicrobiales bacterium]